MADIFGRKFGGEKKFGIGGAEKTIIGTIGMFIGSFLFSTILIVIFSFEVAAFNVASLLLPIIITSQVRSVFGESYVSVEPVATRVLKFWADVIISLKPLENPQIIHAEIEKNNNAMHTASCSLRINGTGIHNCDIF